MSMFEEIIAHRRLCRACFRVSPRVAPADSRFSSWAIRAMERNSSPSIHKRSQRSARAFVSVNCAAVPPSLIASELFGHEKGEFTGAQQRRLGRLSWLRAVRFSWTKLASCLPKLRFALLRVLQEREFERVGGNTPFQPTSESLLAATTVTYRLPLSRARPAGPILSAKRYSRLKCLLCASVRRTSDALEHFVKNAMPAG